MSRFDQDREEVIRILYSILDYASLGYQVSTCDSCNNCKKNECEYRPEWGEKVRWRCPLWEGDKIVD